MWMWNYLTGADPEEGHEVSPPVCVDRYDSMLLFSSPEYRSLVATN